MNIPLILTVCAPFIAGGFIAVNIATAVGGRRSLPRLGNALLRGLHRRAEFVELFGGPPATDEAGEAKKTRTWLGTLTGTRLGIWGLLSSSCFLLFWIGDWVSPKYVRGFIWHLLGSWASGMGVASLAFAGMWAIESSFRMGRARLFGALTGFRRIWIIRAGRSGRHFRRKLLEAFTDAKRIDLLDFTGYELLAKGLAETGGMVATLIARFPEKPVRLLLFDPCAQEIDPDRKHSTVIESQLGTMDMSREAFEARLRATLKRVVILNHHRQLPIEVRLYKEKPSFRILVAGDVSFLGAIGSRDGHGEIPLQEAHRHSQGHSLHGAARSHFLRLWGDSVPVVIDADTSIHSPSPTELSRPTSAVVPKPAVVPKSVWIPKSARVTKSGRVVIG